MEGKLTGMTGSPKELSYVAFRDYGNMYPIILSISTDMVNDALPSLPDGLGLEVHKVLEIFTDKWLEAWEKEVIHGHGARSLFLTALASISETDRPTQVFRALFAEAILQVTLYLPAYVECLGFKTNIPEQYAGMTAQMRLVHEALGKDFKDMMISNRIVPESSRMFPTQCVAPKFGTFKEHLQKRLGTWLRLFADRVEGTGDMVPASDLGNCDDADIQEDMKETTK
jgi:hypothetical protein